MNDLFAAKYLISGVVPESILGFPVGEVVQLLENLGGKVNPDL